MQISFQVPEYTTEVDSVGTLRFLDAIRKDMDKHSIEGFSGKNSQDEVLSILNKQGITILHPTANNQQPTASITLWGTGKVYHEFLHVDYMANACVHILNTVEADKLYNELKQTHFNIGTGVDLTIKKLAELIKEVVGFEGRIEWNSKKPDGTYKKQLDVGLLKSLNWEAKIGLKEGLLDLKARLQA